MSAIYVAKYYQHEIVHGKNLLYWMMLTFMMMTAPMMSLLMMTLMTGIPVVCESHH